jgi:hypothetical protein
MSSLNRSENSLAVRFLQRHQTQARHDYLSLRDDQPRGAAGTYVGRAIARWLRREHDADLVEEQRSQLVPELSAQHEQAGKGDQVQAEIDRHSRGVFFAFIKKRAANPPESRCLPPQLSWYTKEEN